MKKKKYTQIARRGDCVKLLRNLSRPADLIIADPPYNQGMPYAAYDDNLAHDSYMAWTRQWLTAATAALSRHGAMWVFVPDEWVSEVDVLAKTKCNLFKRQHVIWTFTFGQRCSKKFSRSHCHLLHFTKTKTQFTFNADEVKVPSARQLVYNDKRAVAGGKPPDDTWMLLDRQLRPYMGGDRDVWLEARICGTFKERKKHSPNQIPVPIMERIILATSNRGDMVVDPFAGTCSSGVACAKLKRNWCGFDLSRVCVVEGRKRIKAALEE